MFDIWSIVHKITIHIKVLIITLFLYLINAFIFIFSNETNEYTPRRKRVNVYQSLKRKLNQCIIRIEEKIEYIQIQLTSAHNNKNRTKRCKYKSKKYVRIMSYGVMALEVKAMKRSNIVRFDTDSAPVGIDNRCTGCISHVAQDFIGQLRESGKSIKGFGGTRTSNVKVGTLLWRWMDDNGNEFKFTIPNSFYVPSGGVRLLSPQHWAKTQRGSKKNGHHGTLSQTTSNDITLMWNERKNKLTVPLSKESNVGTFHLAPGYNKYDEFRCMMAMEQDDMPIISMEAPISQEKMNEKNPGIWKRDRNDVSDSFNDKEPIETNWDMNEDHVKEYNKINPEDQIEWNALSTDNKDETTNSLLKLHQQFGHISFAKLQIMAKKGVIPSKYGTCDIPVCQACAYAKMIRKPWRNKPMAKYVSDQDNLKPGDIISVDQMVSPVPGFIAQMTGKLTTKRYKYSTVFVDQSSKLGYVHLQKSQDADETVEAKITFETFMQTLGITVRAYHADNGIFRAHKWVNACNERKQRLTFAGVNAHHQNGVAERRIRELQELARTMMIHANRRWKNVHSTMLWPYAFRMANNLYNNAPLLKNKDNLTPMQIATGSTVEINKKHIKTFGCPAYVLSRSLQLGRPHGKWDERSKMGIYLGPSPVHNKNVALVMDMDTGLVSPQFHVMFDNEFRTVENDKTVPMWKVRTGLLTEREIEISQRKRDAIPIIVPGLETRPEGGKNTQTNTKKRAIVQKTDELSNKRAKYFHKIGKSEREKPNQQPKSFCHHCI